jgi:hypothetical protein
MKDGKDSYGDKIQSDFIGKGCREGIFEWIRNKAEIKKGTFDLYEYLATEQADYLQGHSDLYLMARGGDWLEERGSKDFFVSPKS